MQKLILDLTSSWSFNSAGRISSGVPVAQMASSDEANGLLDEPGPAPTHSMKHDDLIKPDEQGLWYRNSRDYWPVLVLRNDLVPDRIREDPCEDKVPVFLINKNDM